MKITNNKAKFFSVITIILCAVFISSYLVKTDANAQSTTEYREEVVYSDDFTSINTNTAEEGFKVGSDTDKECCYVVIPNNNVIWIEKNTGKYNIYIKAYIPDNINGLSPRDLVIWYLNGETPNVTDPNAEKYAFVWDKMPYDINTRYFTYTINSDTKPFNQYDYPIRLQIKNSKTLKDPRSETFFIKKIEVKRLVPVTVSPTPPVTDPPPTDVTPSVTNPVTTNPIDSRITAASGYKAGGTDLAMPSNLPSTMIVSKVEYLDNGWVLKVKYNNYYWAIQGLKIPGEESKQYATASGNVWVDVYCRNGFIVPSSPWTVATSILAGVKF